MLLKVLHIRLVRAFSAWAVVAAASVATNPVHAQDKACIQSYEDVQVHRRASQLITARDAAVRCASGCPAALAKDCAQWISEIESSIPRVVLEARDGNGIALVEVSVLIDGKAAVSRLQGRTIEVDPGPHTFSFATKGAAEVSVQTVVVESEKNQRISAQFPDFFLSKRNAPTPKVTWVFAGVGALSLGVAAVFGTMAWNQRQDLENQGCAPVCPGNDVARLGRLTTLTDVSLGVGITALAGAAAVWWVTRRPEATRVAMAKHSMPSLYAMPLQGGASFGTRLIW